VCLMNVLQPVRLTAPGLRATSRAARRLPASVRAPSARAGYKPLDHFTDEHAPSRRSYVTTPRGVAHFRPARFVAGGQLGSGQSTDESGSTTATLRVQPELAVTLCVQPRKADCKTTPQYQQIEETGAA